MKTQATRILFVALLLFLTTSSVKADTIQQGIDAFKTENYAAALRIFKPLAEQGDTDAQYTLGVMYAQGKGVAQNDSEAVKWYRLAAEQGNADAQYNLGLRYIQGRGVAENFVRAHKWMNLAAASGDSSAAEKRSTLSRLMTPAQIAEAQRLAAEWVNQFDQRAR